MPLNAFLEGQLAARFWHMNGNPTSDSHAGTKFGMICSSTNIERLGACCNSETSDFLPMDKLCLAFALSFNKKVLFRSFPSSASFFNFSTWLAVEKMRCGTINDFTSNHSSSYFKLWEMLFPCLLLFFLLFFFALPQKSHGVLVMLSK